MKEVNDTVGELREEHTKCEVCGHKTSVLQSGTGSYADKMVCGLCEDRNMREQLLRLKITTARQALVDYANEVFEAYFEMGRMQDGASNEFTRDADLRLKDLHGKHWRRLATLLGIPDAVFKPCLIDDDE